MNIVACVAAVKQHTDRAGRTIEVNAILKGNADVGTQKKPNRAGIDLLHQRALFVTELQKQGVWP